MLFSDNEFRFTGRQVFYNLRGVFIMKKNVGIEDRYIRFLVGFSLLLNIIVLEPGILGGIILAVLAIGILVSVYTSYCWVYDILNISTTSDQPLNEEGDAPQTQE